MEDLFFVVGDFLEKNDEGNDFEKKERVKRRGLDVVFIDRFKKRILRKREFVKK